MVESVDTPGLGSGDLIMNVVRVQILLSVVVGVVKLCRVIDSSEQNRMSLYCPRQAFGDRANSTERIVFACIE